MSGTRWLVVAALLIQAMATGCTTDAGGHNWTAINDSDHDVIVDVTSEQSVRLLIPAHVHTWLGSGWSSPGPGWGATVMDVNCRVIANLAITPPDANLYIAPDLTVDISHGNAFNGPGARVDTSNLPSPPPCPSSGPPAG